MNLIKFIESNIHDILIFLGLIVFIITMFNFISSFVGWISLSIVLIGIGCIIARNR